jgi:hypothetical protein
MSYLNRLRMSGTHPSHTILTKRGTWYTPCINSNMNLKDLYTRTAQDLDIKIRSTIGVLSSDINRTRRVLISLHETAFS